MLTFLENKNIRFLLLSISFLYLISCSYKAIVEFYVAKYGKIVQAKVIDVSKLCEYKRKYVTLLVDSETIQFKIYGPSCRHDEFLLGSIIQIRSNTQLGILTLQNNYSSIRLVFFLLFTICILIALISMLNSIKKNNSIFAFKNG